MTQWTKTTAQPGARSFRKPGLLVLAGALGLGVIALGAFAWSRREDEGPVGTVNGELTYTVTRGDLIVSFTERGSVKAAHSEPIYCQVEGMCTIVSIVPEGTYVKKGDLLVEMDSSQLEQQVNQQEISVETSEASWKQAVEQLAIQKSLNQSNTETSQLEVELAEIDLQKYLEGDYRQALDVAKSDIVIKLEELTRARDKAAWTKKLAARGYVTRMDEQADDLAVTRAEVQHQQAERALEVLEKYTHTKDLKTYRSNLEQAKAALTRATRQATAEEEKAKADAKSKESTYRLQAKRLEKLKDQLAKTRITAPEDGMVVYEEPHWRGGRDTVIEQGSNVYENQKLMELPDVAVMKVDVQVHESWIDQVKEGLPAIIGIDALPNMNARGTITKVGLLPDQVNRWLNPNLKVYRTEVTIDAGQETALLRPGMSAKVQIIVTRLEDIVYVPVQSLTTIDKQQVVYVLEGGEFRPHEVEGGLYNESYIEIVSGLEPGEVIQLNAPSPEGGSDWDEVEGAEEASLLVKGRRPEQKAHPDGKGDRAGPRLPGKAGAEPGRRPGGAGGPGRGRGPRAGKPGRARPAGEGKPARPKAAEDASSQKAGAKAKVAEGEGGSTGSAPKKGGGTALSVSP